jgi:hypothetical protein
LYERRAHELELRGLSPTGVFRRCEREADRLVLDAWAAGLDRLAIEANDLGLHRFGRATTEGSDDVLHPPLEIGVKTFRRGGELRETLEIIGRTQPLSMSRPSSLAFVIRRSRVDKLQRRRYALAAYVEHLALSAAGLLEGVDSFGSLIIAAKPDGRFETYEARFDVLSADEARTRLVHIASDLLSGVHGYALPFEAVFARLDAKFPSTLEYQIRRLFDGRDAFSSRRGPVPDVNIDQYPPLEESLALEYVQQRLGPFVDSLELGGKRR